MLKLAYSNVCQKCSGDFAPDPHGGGGGKGMGREGEGEWRRGGKKGREKAREESVPILQTKSTPMITVFY